jgi:predicted transcriptional regulator of viral defense system
LYVSRKPASPNWDHLYESASAQDGYFTLLQAERSGYSPQLLQKHIQSGRVTRARRGIYRLVHFPSGEREDLTITWLWSQQAGVFSHQTALALHDLSDALPSGIHLALPLAWRSRRLRVPEGITLHHMDVPERDRTWIGAVPVTGPRRTLQDCARDSIAPDLLRQGAQQALRRGLVARTDLAEVERALAPFGGISR